MQITVKYEAQAKRAAGVGSESIELSDSSCVSDAIRHLAELHSDTLRPVLINSAGDVQKSLLLFLGDDQVVQGDDKQLSDGDTLTILPPISGG